MNRFWSALLIFLWFFELQVVLFSQEPGISFSSVPPLGSEGNLTGKVHNVSPADHGVAVYIFVQGWWNKPSFAAPLTPIGSNGAWTCDIVSAGADSVARKVAAFLVPKDYQPPLLEGTAVLPHELFENSLATLQAARRSENAFSFSGYDWDVKTSGSFGFGPGPNVFSDDPENVWVDEEGKLHLKITYRDGVWNCAEVVSFRSFGYGTYRFYVESALDELDANVVLGLFTWSDDPAYAYREIDVEIAKWSNPSDPTNAQFVVQPWNNPGNLARWTIPPGAAPTTHSFDWEASEIRFESHNGEVQLPITEPPVISQWNYMGNDIPVPGDEQVRMNLWLVNGLPPTDGQEVEIVISRFAFIPSTLPEPDLTSVDLNEDGLVIRANGQPQLFYFLESASGLEDWEEIDSRVVDETEIQFTVPVSPDSENKFYRIRVPDQ
ncbi:MAG: glycoside hydrolase family 16 protein [Puniceicoccaceae bacterium]